jgi:hypothetical protein
MHGKVKLFGWETKMKGRIAAKVCHTLLDFELVTDCHLDSETTSSSGYGSVGCLIS